MHSDLPTSKEIRDNIRDELPSHMFKPTPTLLISPTIYAISTFALAYYINADSPWWVLALSILWIGHAFFCVATFAHNLSHNSVVRNTKLKYTLELFFWSLAYFPPTIWRMTHNKTHHPFVNQEKDTFRHFAEEEINEKRSRKWVNWLLSPKKGPRFSPTVYLSYLVYQIAYIVSAVLRTNGTHSSVVAYLPKYSSREHRFIYFELLILLLIQSVFFILLDASVILYLVVIGLSMVTTGAFASAYLYTQHNTYGIQKDNHPLKSTTSIILPKGIDISHQYLSHHVEHHIFPGMSAKYYPAVAEILARDYPTAFDRRNAFSVLRESYKRPENNDNDTSRLSNSI